MEYNKILIIKSNNNSFEEFYNSEMKKAGVDVISLDALRTHYPEKKITNMCSILKNLIIKPCDIDFKRYDLFVVFEDEKVIPIIKRYKQKNAKIVLWNWNIQSKEQAENKNRFKKWCEIWTFDSSDSKKYGWKLNNQFYFLPRIIENKRATKRLNAFCACVDKGRYSVMREIKSILEENNVECDFWLVKENAKQYLEEDESWLIDDMMPYNIFLDHVKDSDIVVDIVQKEQKGMTVRVLEALFYDKKIITNNEALRESDVYNENSMFIWRLNSKGNIFNFCQSKYQEDKTVDKDKYTFENWIKKMST